MIDLHTHSNRSDGSDPPERIPELAAAAGCGVVALTDHDRLDGVEAARARGWQLGVEVVAGCELSCDSDWGSVHVLAYFVDGAEGPLQHEMAQLQRWRVERNQRLVARLVELGLDITLEEVEAEAGGDGVGRPHVAAVLMGKGYVATVQEAFDVWLAKGRPAYVERPRLTVAEAARLVRASGGVAVVAHPFTLGLHAAGLETAVEVMAAAGIDGLEAVYGRYTPAERASLAALARRHGLVATGGSDYHGTYKPDLQVGVGRGDLAVAAETVDELRSRRPPARS